MPEGEGRQDVDQHDRVLAAPILQFDLSNELERLRQRPSYAEGAPTGTTLVKEPDLRIVLIALAAGARMEKHTASGPISIQGLTGRCRLYTPQGEVELSSGTLLAVEPAIPHDVEAIEDAAFLLTIGRTTYHAVSDRHEHHL